MKIFVLIAAIALGIFLTLRMQKPAPEATAPIPAASSAAAALPAPEAPPTALRRPILQTQQTLKEVERRTGAGEF
jgi:hypothetical protein